MNSDSSDVEDSSSSSLRRRKRNQAEKSTSTSDEFLPQQFDVSSSSTSLESIPFPWSSALLGAFLLLCGVGAFITLISDVIQGYEDEDDEVWLQKDYDKVPAFKKSDRFWPLFMLGFISLTPGAYVTFFVVMALLGVEGYSYLDIP